MIENEDRLSDDFWTESELNKMAKNILTLDDSCEEKTQIVIYKLLKENKFTGLCMIVAVNSIMDGEDAIKRLWNEVGITAEFECYSEESVLNIIKCERICKVLSKYKYIGKNNLIGSDKIFKYQSWMNNLIT